VCLILILELLSLVVIKTLTSSCELRVELSGVETRQHSDLELFVCGTGAAAAVTKIGSL